MRYQTTKLLQMQIQASSWTWKAPKQNQTKLQHRNASQTGHSLVLVDQILVLCGSVAMIALIPSTHQWFNYGDLICVFIPLSHQPFFSLIMWFSWDFCQGLLWACLSPKKKKRPNKLLKTFSFSRIILELFLKGKIKINSKLKKIQPTNFLIRTLLTGYMFL